MPILTHKKEAGKSDEKDGKALYKLINNAVYSKAMENLRDKMGIKWECWNRAKDIFVFNR